jgi:hypothetical protein
MSNPLSQYFRQPSIYVKLPSKGEYYTPGSISMSANGELPVLPMTAIDEITYRTPDALYNGQATVNVIQSCVPAVKDAWAVPAVDLDTLLIGIRIASYGHDMDFATRCPACGNESEHTIDLRSVLDHIRAPDYTKTIESGDMQIFFKPMTYRDLNNNNQLQFEQQKLMQVLPDSAVSENDKMNALSDALKKITEITVHALAQSIAAIKTPTAMVTESQYIEEFLQNCDRTLFNRIRDFIIEAKSVSEMQPLRLTCQECNNQYEQTVTLDMSSFFGSAS